MLVALDIGVIEKLNVRIVDQVAFQVLLYLIEIQWTAVPAQEVRTVETALCGALIKQLVWYLFTLLNRTHKHVRLLLFIRLVWNLFVPFHLAVAKLGTLVVQVAAEIMLQ